MGTKNDRKPNDCYHKAEPDEPMFVLLGRDKHAPQLVELWAGQRATEGEDPAKVEEVLKCAKAMRRYRYERKGAPECEYCEAGGEDPNCTKTSTKLVTENDFVWYFWCGSEESFLYSEAGVQTIEEYFATEEVSNEYCNNEPEDRIDVKPSIDDGEDGMDGAGHLDSPCVRDPGLQSEEG